jgi:hypothetical protein
MRLLGFGLIFGCVVVFFHRGSPVMFFSNIQSMNQGVPW